MQAVARTACILLLAIASVLFLSHPAAAQQRPAPVIQIAAGTYLFPDDGETIPEGFLGGAGRFYLTPRISVGPEIAFVAGANHSHWILTGNLTFDFLKSSGGLPRSFTPFVVVGGGYYSTRADFFDRGVDTSYEGAFTAGGGVRGRVGPRVTLGAEARIGWEPHLRLNAFVGIEL